MTSVLTNYVFPSTGRAVRSVLDESAKPWCVDP